MPRAVQPISKKTSDRRNNLNVVGLEQTERRGQAIDTAIGMSPPPNDEAVAASADPIPIVGSAELDSDRAARSGQYEIPETRWSIVIRASDPNSDAGVRALQQLCVTYWQSLYGIARMKQKNHDEALDLVQEFITRLLSGKRSLGHPDPARGSFRNFLWTNFTRFLIDNVREHNRVKSGGRMKAFSFDARGYDGNLIIEPVIHLKPENAFVKLVALETIQNAKDQLKAVWKEKGQLDTFNHLQQYLASNKFGGKGKTLATQLGISEQAARRRVTDFRKQLRAILRRNIAQTLSNPTKSDVDAEMDFLFEALNL